MSSVFLEAETGWLLSPPKWKAVLWPLLSQFSDRSTLRWNPSVDSVVGLVQAVDLGVVLGPVPDPLAIADVPPYVQPVPGNLLIAERIWKKVGRRADVMVDSVAPSAVTRVAEVVFGRCRTGL